MKQLILILGGARSGKSRYAQTLAHELGGDQVLYVATAEPLDEEMRSRIEMHRAERPGTWHTLEASRDVASRIGSADRWRVVLLDCMTLLVSNLLLAFSEEPQEAMAHRLEREIDDLMMCYEANGNSWIVVSNEVGLGLVPDNRLGRLYRDLLGRVNQRFAAKANRVLFMVAGIPITIK